MLGYVSVYDARVNRPFNHSKLVGYLKKKTQKGMAYCSYE